MGQLFEPWVFFVGRIYSFKDNILPQIEFLYHSKLKWNFKEKSSIYKEHKIRRNKFNKTHAGSLPENDTVLLREAGEVK